MIPRDILSCCLGAAAFHFLGRSTGRDAETLKSAIRVNQLKDLSQYLGTACKVLPLVVAISGRVGSDSPIKCQRSGLRGVIVEETAEQLFLRQNEAGSWIQDSALMLSMIKEVQWYLDDGTDHVFVTGARNAKDFELTVGSEVFEELGRSFVRGTLDYLQGLKILGIRRIERVLPVGTVLTVIGEVVKDDVGTIRVQSPHRGLFCVSTQSINELNERFGKWVRWYNCAFWGFSAFGSYLIVKWVLQFIMGRYRQFCYRVLGALGSLVGRRKNEDGERREERRTAEGAEIDQIPSVCVVCLENPCNAVFLECGHMHCCMECSQSLYNCPLCRNHIQRIVQVNPGTTDLLCCRSEGKMNQVMRLQLKEEEEWSR